MTDPTEIATIRLLINAPTDAQVFTDDEITTFLTLEGGNVKRAAAQAIDTIADNEVLVSKVMRTRAGVQTDGAKVADALRMRATELRAQADMQDEDDDGYFDVIDLDDTACRTERTQYPC